MTSFRNLFFATALLLAMPTAFAQEECSLPESTNSAIERLCAVSDGMVRLRIGARWGFADLQGRIAVEPRFAEAADFSEGLAIVQGDDEKWGVIDRQGTWVLQPQFDSLGSFSHGRAVAGKGGKAGYIDRSGNWVVAPAYETAGPFNGASSFVSEAYLRDLLLGADGQVLKRFDASTSVTQYPNIRGLYLATVKGGVLLQNRDGRRLANPLATAYAVRSNEGLIIAPLSVKRGDGNVDLFGAMDVTGKWVIPATFRALEPFQSGLAVAQWEDVGGKPLFGLIDAKGRRVAEPMYEELARSDRGWFRGKRLGGGEDVLGTTGERLVSFSCGEPVEPLDLSLSDAREWSVMKGCGQTWLVFRGQRAFKAGITATDAQATPKHLLLMEKPENAEDSGKFTRIELYDGNGKRLLSQDEVKFDNGYDYAELLAPTADGAAAPLALLVRKYEKVEIVTQDLRIVADGDWQYDSAINNYSYSSSQYRREGPLPLKGSGGWGAVDGAGGWVIQPRYSELSTFRDGMAFASRDGVEYVIDLAGGEHAFPERGRQFQRMGPNLLVGRGDNGEIIRFEPANNVVTVHEVAQGLQVGDFREGLAVVRNDDYRSGLIDTQGRMVLPLNFSDLQAFDQDGSRFGDARVKRIGWRSTQVRKTDNGELQLHGWLDAAGKEIIAPQYDELEYDASSQALMVKREALKGVLRLDGTPLLEVKYGDINYSGDGWYVATGPERQGLLDAKGDWVSPPDDLYLSDLFEDGFSYAQLNRETVLFDAGGRRATRSRPLQLAADDPQTWWYPDSQASENGTPFYGVDFRERLKVPGRVGVRARFSEGVISFVPANSTPEKGFGLIESSGKVLGLYPFDSIEPMHEGLAAFTQTKLVKDAAITRAGYLDRSGKIAIAAQFDAATRFKDARAAVVSQQNIAMIDTTGKVLLRGAWLCARDPMIVDGAGKVLWPDAARATKNCN